MKTTLAKIQKAGKLDNFFVFEGQESFPLIELEEIEDIYVELTDLGYQGKDIDNLECWKVVAEGQHEGDAFKAVGTFYNQNHYENFLKAIK
jgi:hypothetical protein